MAHVLDRGRRCDSHGHGMSLERIQQRQQAAAGDEPPARELAIEPLLLVGEAHDLFVAQLPIENDGEDVAITLAVDARPLFLVEGRQAVPLHEGGEGRHVERDVVEHSAVEIEDGAARCRQLPAMRLVFSAAGAPGPARERRYWTSGA